MKNLENYGVHEMNAKEIKETDGGFLLEVALLAVGTAMYFTCQAVYELGKAHGAQHK